MCGCPSTTATSVVPSSPRVLARVSLQEVVERGVTAREIGPLVDRVEWFNDQVNRGGTANPWQPSLGRRSPSEGPLEGKEGGRGPRPKEALAAPP